MDETWTLIFLSLAMFVACYLAGSVPLAIPLSESKLKLVSVLGAGLLVGTALAVIIPEGIHTLISLPQHSHEELKEDQLVPSSNPPIDHHHNGHHHHGEPGIEAVRWIGISLVLGFVFMLLVDQIGGSHRITNTNDGGTQNRNNVTATLGLVVHAAADGIALGAAASTSQIRVEMIIFAAIMLHKAPAAFGLVSFLLHEGFDRNRIRKHLLVFALAAPVLAIVTFFGLSQRSKEVLTEVNATGIVMLFSGGTFLYVAAVHILPELKQLGSTIAVTSLPEPAAGISMTHIHKSGFTNVEVFAMVCGCLLPLFLTLGHHH